MDVQLTPASALSQPIIDPDRLPAIITQSGDVASRRFVEFFAAHIRNAGTRRKYGHAVARFCHWCDERGIALEQIEPIVVAAYIEELMGKLAKPTVKLHLAAIRMLFDYLVTGQVLPFNPAASVRGPKHVVEKGKTPVLSAEETRWLLDSIDTSTIAGLRDRALIGLLVYSFARVSAATNMNVEDYFMQGRRMWFRFLEKGGKHHDVPAHPEANRYMDLYLREAGIASETLTPLFRTLERRKFLSERRMSQTDVLRMIKRRAMACGLPASTCCHTFRATGITTYLQSGGSLEHARRIAGHQSSRTTKLYDRTNDAIDIAEIERIVI